MSSCRWDGIRRWKLLRIVSIAEEASLRGARDALLGECWPSFMQGDLVSAYFWPRLDEDFGEFKLILVDHDGIVAGASNAIPFYWSLRNEDLPETGWDGILEQGMTDRDNNRAPNALCALAI